MLFCSALDILLQIASLFTSQAFIFFKLWQKTVESILLYFCQAISGILAFERQFSDES